MAIQTTYTNARANLAALCDEVTANREVVIIHRRGAEDVAWAAFGFIFTVAALSFNDARPRSF